MVAQPAEERGAGARAMLAEGLFERFPVPDFAIALHNDAGMPAGRVGVCSGYALAGVDSIDLVVRGVSGHGGYPSTTKDPVVMAAQTVLSLQTIVSREIPAIDPAVVTVGSIHGGSKHSIIPDEVRLQLTVRYYTDATRDRIRTGIGRIAEGIARAAGVPPRPHAADVGAGQHPAHLQPSGLEPAGQSSHGPGVGRGKCAGSEAGDGRRGFRPLREDPARGAPLPVLARRRFPREDRSQHQAGGASPALPPLQPLRTRPRAYPQDRHQGTDGHRPGVAATLALIGDNVVYIGKGSIRDRYQTDPRRASWGISKIEYSVIKDDQKSLEWEDWWLKRFRKKNNGHRPKYNQTGGVGDVLR